MGKISGMEFIVILVQAIIFIGIPLAVASWIIQTLRRIRADHETIKSKLESIEQKLGGPTRN